MDKNNSLVQELETSPVVDTVNYIGEVHYKIGTRLYIENAD
jgi:hypothetical protein